VSSSPHSSPVKEPVERFCSAAMTVFRRERQQADAQLERGAVVNMIRQAAAATAVVYDQEIQTGREETISKE